MLIKDENQRVSIIQVKQAIGWIKSQSNIIG
jgi:hypothetical protein